MRPLYVRLPDEAAEKLHQAAFELGLPKQDIVTQLLQDHLAVGQHSFVPADPDEVLTLAEVAKLLRVDEDAVTKLADSGELPGRRLGNEWRFTRAAVLRWLGGEDES